MSQEFENTVGV